MDPAEAYKLIQDRLSALLRGGFAPLSGSVDQPCVSESVRIGNENCQLETAVLWCDEKRRRLEIRVRALGPSTWKIDRLEESAFIEVEKAE